MKKVLEKFFAIITGLITSLLLLEIALRIFGSCYESNIPSDNIDIVNKKKDEYNILCIGDSHTYGLEVGRQQSYPGQLQLFFNAHSNKKIRVINKGVLTQNTTQALNILQEQIDDIHPDIIILLTGGANHWNYYGYCSVASNILYSIRVFKLAKLLLKNIGDISSETVIETNQATQDNEEYSSEIELYKEKIIENPANPENYFYTGFYNLKQQNMQEAIRWFKRGIKADPHYGNNYMLINFTFIMFQNKINKAISWLNEEIRKNPDNPLLYELLSYNYNQLGRKRESIDYMEKAKRTRNKMKIYYSKIRSYNRNLLETRATEIDNSFMEIISGRAGFVFGCYDFGSGKNKDKVVQKNQSLVSSWIESDMKKIIEICRKNGVRIIITNYAIKPEPNSWTKTAESVNVILEDVAEENSVPFIDVNSKFLQAGSYRKDFFQKTKNDAHPNARGYRLMASEIYDRIIEENIINDY